MRRELQLNEAILATFARACTENRLDVAEHLLCALEVLDSGRDMPGPRLAEAYRSIGARAHRPGSHARRPTRQSVKYAGST